MQQVSAYDIVVFDMEDALVDRRSSECAAVSRAIDSYLTSLLGVGTAGGPVFTPDEVKSFMDSQGFEPDVELMNVLLALALHNLSVEIPERQFEGYDGRELLDAVRKSGLIKDTLGDLAGRKNLAEFGKMLRQKGGGKRGFARLRGLRNRFLVLSEGHIMMDNMAERVFAEAYLGEELFHKEYGQARLFVHEEGTIALEQAWLEAQDIAYLRQRTALAAVTSRRQSEAQHVLQMLGLAQYLVAVVGEGGGWLESPEENEWMRSFGLGAGAGTDYPSRVSDAIERTRVQEALEGIPRVAYVGNCVPEQRGLVGLKERYNLVLIGCVFGQDPKLLQHQKERGATLVATDPKQLIKVLTERPRVRTEPGYGY